MEEIRLQCLLDHGKLRVRIISPGYNSDANCQFPRDIRVEGREYLVPVSDVTFTENTNQKFFYRIKTKNIKICQNTTDIKIYGEDGSDCVICLDKFCMIVFIPCGHYNTCEECSLKINTCPTCRKSIIKSVKKDQL